MKWVSAIWSMTLNDFQFHFNNIADWSRTIGKMLFIANWKWNKTKKKKTEKKHWQQKNRRNKWWFYIRIGCFDGMSRTHSIQMCALIHQFQSKMKSFLRNSVRRTPLRSDIIQLFVNLFYFHICQLSFNRRSTIHIRCNNTIVRKNNKQKANMR